MNMGKKSLSVQEASAHYQLSAGNAPLLPPGYKQTEVGVIPEDWEVRALGDISDIYRGASPRPIESPIWFDEQSQIGWVRISDVTKSKRRLQETTQRLSELGVRHSRFVPKGSLIMSICASVGKPVITDIDVCIHDGFVVFERQRVLQNFLYHSLKALESGWSKSGQTGSQMNLNTGIINPTRIPFPPTKAEQEAIAEALSDADALIESLEQLITKKRHIKQGAMQELLTGKKRLPGFSGEWSIISMRKHASIKARIGWQALTTEEYLDSGMYYLVTGTDFIGGRVNWSTCHFVDEWRYKQDRNIQLKNGDVLLTKDGTIGKVGYVENLHIPATLNSGVFVIRPLDKAFVELFVFYILVSKVFDEFLSKITAGSTITHLYQKDFVTFEFLAPELNEQTAIAAILSDMDAEIAALEEKLAKTRAIKQGIMHNLLTGKIRLVDPAVVKVEQHALSDVERIPAAPRPDKSHNWAFNEAVVIAVLADLFAGKPEFPLGRKRYTKLSYLMHRKAEQEVQGYLKKAAGPYNPKTKYSGPEKIAQENGYIRQHENGNYRGFIAGEKIEQAKAYFIKWYGSEIIAWLEQFRYRSNDDLELLATVDMAMQELLKQGKAVDVDSVRALIASEPEWLPKLERSVFSDSGIAAAISECQAFFTM